MPNDNIAKARKMKIDKAVQYGANWVREWDAAVTHIVVDKDLKYTDVLKVLGVSHLPVRTEINSMNSFNC